MEGEDRRGRKSRQYDDRLAIHDGEAERLARLECNAMDENIAELGDDAMRQIARALRRAAGEHDQIARCERAANGTFQGRLIVRERAEGHRFPTSFRDRSRDDSPVAVVDPCGAERVSRRRKLVAGREHGDSWPAHHLDLGEAAGGEHPDFTR